MSDIPPSDEEQQPSASVVVEDCGGEEEKSSSRRKTMRGDVMNTLHRPIYTHCEDNKAARILPQKTLPTALKVHPKGFRVLSGRSPIERGLMSYFRLPMAPSGQRLRDMKRVKRMLHMKGRRSERKKSTKLDGWALLHASNVADPEDATEAVMTDIGIRGVVQEEMSFFNKLEYLDIGENEVQFHELQQLRNLEELHLHCSQLATLKFPGDTFQNLETLNLSYNRFSDHSVLETLCLLPVLFRLDLSGNRFTTLPETLPFKSLQKLALEGNCLSGNTVFESLGTIPTLQEVNLNGNNLTKIKKIEGSFLSLSVIGLSQNNFSYFEDLYPLVMFPELKRAVLWGNPISRRHKDTSILLYELNKVNIQVYLEGPIPKNRNLGEFYVANCKNMIRVSELQRACLHKKDSEIAPVVVTEDEQQSHTSFFMTETGIDPNQPASPKKTTVKQQQPSKVKKSHNYDAATRPWFALDSDNVEREAVDELGTGGVNVPVDLSVVDNNMESVTVPVCDSRNIEDLLQRITSPAQSEDPSRRKPSTLKGAYRELRLALRTPLTNPVGTKLIRRGRPRPGNCVSYLGQNTTTAIQPTPPPSTGASRLPPLE